MPTFNRVGITNNHVVEAKVCVAELASTDQQSNQLQAALCALITTVAFLVSFVG